MNGLHSKVFRCIIMFTTTHTTTFLCFGLQATCIGQTTSCRLLWYNCHCTSDVDRPEPVCSGQILFKFETTKMDQGRITFAHLQGQVVAFF